MFVAPPPHPTPCFLLLFFYLKNLSLLLSYHFACPFCLFFVCLCWSVTFASSFFFSFAFFAWFVFPLLSSTSVVCVRVRIHYVCVCVHYPLLLRSLHFLEGVVVKAFLLYFHLTMGASVRFCLFACVCVCACVYCILAGLDVLGSGELAGVEVPSKVIVPSIYWGSTQWEPNDGWRIPTE